MPTDLCFTCGKAVIGWRTVKGNRVPKHSTAALNKECVRLFNERLQYKRAASPDISSARWAAFD
jgi:hypothetical protein